MTTTSQVDQLRELKELLDASGKHVGYQAVPPQLIRVDSRFSSLTGGHRLDAQRFDWLAAQVRAAGITGGSAIDIGANQGYFSVRLAAELNCQVTAYEPHTPHARALGLVRDLCGLSAQIDVRNEGVALADIERLPDVDLICLLNVVQHAGQDFDGAHVPTIEAWPAYAREYLAKMRTKTRYMFFQLGYTWVGSNGKFCQDQEVAAYTRKLLTDAGYEVVAAATPKSVFDASYQTVSNFTDADNFQTGLVPRIVCKLNSSLDSRFMQRPLWFLKAK